LVKARLNIHFQTYFSLILSQHYVQKTRKARNFNIIFICKKLHIFVLKNILLNLFSFIFKTQSTDYQLINNKIIQNDKKISLSSKKS